MTIVKVVQHNGDKVSVSLAFAEQSHILAQGIPPKAHECIAVHCDRRNRPRV
jgi:hypothetical protein